MDKPYFKPTYRSLNNPKEKAIEKAMDRKEQSIRSFVDTKSASIAVSSAFNGASAICTAMVSNGDLLMENYWEEHRKWYLEYLERFATAQVDGVEMYHRIIQRINDDKAKSLDVGEDDFDTDIQVEAELEEEIKLD